MFSRHARKIVHIDPLFLILVRTDSLRCAPVGRKRQQPFTSFGTFLDWAQAAHKKKFSDLRRWVERHPGIISSEKSVSSQLTHDKIGRNKTIPPERFRMYSEVFCIPYEDLVREWVRWRYNADVHRGDLQEDPLISRIIRLIQDGRNREKIQAMLNVLFGPEVEEAAKPKKRA